MTFQGFDEIFGHILGDPDEHFGLFTGDDVKKRARAKALALAQLRKMHGGDSSFTTAGTDKRRRTRTGSTSGRNSMMGMAGMSISSPAGMSMTSGRAGSMAVLAMNVANMTSGKVRVREE